MQRTRSGFLKLAVTASLLLWASIAVTPAKAALVPFTFYFDGIVDKIGLNLMSGTSTPSLLGTQTGSLNPSMLLSGSYTFTPGAGSVATLPNSASEYSGTISDLHFTLSNGQSVNYSGNINTNAPPSSNTITVGNEVTSVTQVALDGGLEVLTVEPSDTYTVVIPFTGLPPIGASGPAASQLEIYYWHPNILHTQPVPDLFSDTSLPTTPPGITSDTPTPFRVVFTGDNGSVVTGTLFNISQVATPLPPAVILFSAGLVALIGLGAGSWRQKTNG